MKSNLYATALSESKFSKQTKEDHSFSTTAKLYVRYCLLFQSSETTYHVLGLFSWINFGVMAYLVTSLVRMQ